MAFCHDMTATFFINNSSGGVAEGFMDGMNPIYKFVVVGLMDSRKILELDAQLDFEAAKPWLMNDPVKRKPGTGCRQQ
ncbi:hypothetical protein AAG906_007093 [Vitis piasezkii]